MTLSKIFTKALFAASLLAGSAYMVPAFADDAPAALDAAQVSDAGPAAEPQVPAPEAKPAARHHFGRHHGRGHHKGCCCKGKCKCGHKAHRKSRAVPDMSQTPVASAE